MNGLFIGLLQSNPSYFFAVVITVILSITVHELAHGWAAVKLGDRTPIDTGHMTLNPIVHMGLFSIIMLLMFGIAFGAMPVDRSRLRGKYAEAVVAAAGPASNLVLGLIGLLGLGLWLRLGHLDVTNHVHMNGLLLLEVFGRTNFALLLFNLLPLPPLDGSYILANLVPAYRRFLSGDIVRGAMSAVFIAMFMGGSNFIFRTADRASDAVLSVVTGHHQNDDADTADADPPADSGN